MDSMIPQLGQVERFSVSEVEYRRAGLEEKTIAGLRPDPDGDLVKVEDLEVLKGTCATLLRGLKDAALTVSAEVPQELVNAEAMIEVVFGPLPERASTLAPDGTLIENQDEQ